MKLSTGVSIFGWASTFALAWLMIGNKIPVSWSTWLFFSFFTIVALLAGIQSTRRT